MGGPRRRDCIKACFLRGIDGVGIPSRGERGGGLRRTVENITAFSKVSFEKEGEVGGRT